MLAVIIIGLIGGGVIKGIDANARAGRVLDEQVQATNLVTAYLEAIRQIQIPKVPVDRWGDDSLYANVGDNITMPTQYSVVVNIAYSANGIDWVTPYTAANQTLQKISILVSRTGGKPVLSTCTFRTKR